MEWLTKAANAEHSAAQYVLGKLYQDGVYFNKDMDQAMKWFRSAAELGNEYAAYRMGCLLLLGEEIPKDVEAAVKWLSLSAEKRKSVCAVSAWNAISQGGRVFSSSGSGNEMASTGSGAEK